MFIIINGNNRLLNRKFKLLKFPSYIQYKQNITPFLAHLGLVHYLAVFEFLHL